MPLSLEEYAEKIKGVAEKLGVEVETLRREDFRKHAGAARCQGTYSAARRLAAGGEPKVDALPGDMDLRGVSTYQNGQWTIARKRQKTREEILSELLESMDWVPAKDPVITPVPPANDDLLAVYPLGDPHLGMLAWSKETLDDDFDLNVASSLLRNGIRELCSHQPAAKQALVVNLGDFFHSDNQDNRTSRSGHSLDVDSRWSKILVVGLETMIAMIDSTLEVHETVRVVNEIGNHDDHSAYMLSVALDRHYRNEPRVCIDMSPARFHYHVFGRNLIGITHGHSTKHADLESIMAADQKSNWSSTEHRYWLVGHIHHQRKMDYRNCVVESFRTLAPLDSWSSEKGYRSYRDIQRIVLHKDWGEISRSTSTAAYLGQKEQ